jgi:hypothetical protein
MIITVVGPIKRGLLKLEQPRPTIHSRNIDANLCSPSEIFVQEGMRVYASSSQIHAVDSREMVPEISKPEYV